MTTVRGVFAGAGLSPYGSARWGTPIRESAPGVYVVAQTNDIDDSTAPAELDVDVDAVRTLLRVRPEACVDGIPANEATLTSRLGELWVPHEPVVYIGLAGTSIAARTQQFYVTAIGARSPHAGGWPVKMLRRDTLWIHYSPCSDPEEAEKLMVAAFAAGLSDATIAALLDRDAPLPFANLMVPGGLRQRHGLSGVKEPRLHSPTARTARPSIEPTYPERHQSAPRSLRPPGGLRTQNITPADIAGGRIRVPSESKRLFPPERARIDVTLCGEAIGECRWDPKFGPDKERSGQISIPKTVLQRLVRPGGQLTVARAGTQIHLS